MMEVHSKDLNNILQSLSIAVQLINHPEVFTVEMMMPYLEDCVGVVCKNLFVKDKKKRLWLIVARHDRNFKLADVAKQISAQGGLRFADETTLLEKLGVKQGCVTPLAVYQDKDCSVKVVLDSSLVENLERMIYCHPMSNAATVGIKSSDFIKFLKHTGHDPVVLNFEG